MLQRKKLTGEEVLVRRLLCPHLSEVELGFIAPIRISFFLLKKKKTYKLLPVMLLLIPVFEFFQAENILFRHWHYKSIPLYFSTKTSITCQQD